MTETVFTYAAPALKYGRGASREIGYDVRNWGAKRVLLVTDAGVAAVGHPAAVAESLGEHGLVGEDRPWLHEERIHLPLIVRAPDGAVGVDPTGKRSGRGAYLCLQPPCWQAALKKASPGRNITTKSGAGWKRGRDSGSRGRAGPVDVGWLTAQPRRPMFRRSYDPFHSF